MSHPSDALPAGPPDELLAGLTDRLPMVSAIRWLPETTSTNAVLADVDGPTGEVLVADVQTAGRGRRGRTWQAPAGTSLMLSIRLRPSLPPARWPLLPLVTGTALVAAVRSSVPDVDPSRIALKWPNDLQVDGVKAAGILVESAGGRASSAASGSVIVGLGLNVDWRGIVRPDGIEATSLAEVAGADVDRWAVLDAVLSALDHHHRTAELDPAGVVPRYIADCGTLGRQVTADGTTPVTGRAVGLTVDGHLRIRGEDGREQVVASGDVVHLR